MPARVVTFCKPGSPIVKAPSPLLGFNNNVRHKGRMFHIQTEDSGIRHPHIITHLFADGGRILKTTKTSYAEHVGAESMAETVRELMKEQHKAMFIALRDGQLDYLFDASAPRPSAPSTPDAPRAAMATIPDVPRPQAASSPSLPRPPSPSALDLGRAPSAPDLPRASAPTVPEPPRARPAPERARATAPTVPDLPRAPSAPDLPRAPSAPDLPRATAPTVPEPPRTPSAPDLTRPTAPTVPDVPRAPSAPELPRATAPTVPDPPRATALSRLAYAADRPRAPAPTLPDGTPSRPPPSLTADPSAPASGAKLPSTRPPSESTRPSAPQVRSAATSPSTAAPSPATARPADRPRPRRRSSSRQRIQLDPAALHSLSLRGSQGAPGSAPAKDSAPPGELDLDLDLDALERAASEAQSPVTQQVQDLPPPPASVMNRRGEVGAGVYSAVHPSEPAAPAPLAVEQVGSGGRYAPSRPSSIFATTRPAEGASIFGEDLISEKSLDEVILSYLAEDLDGPQEKK